MSLRAPRIARGYRPWSGRPKTTAYAGGISRGVDRRRTNAGDEGSSLAGLIVAVLVMGVAAAVVVSQLGSTTVPTLATTTTSSRPGTTTTTSRTTTSSTVLTVIGQALVTECDSDYSALAAAILDYETLNGAPPAAGTAWATSRAKGGPYVQSWPSGEGRFAIRWNATSLEVVPTRGTASVGSAGTPSPPTGCDAL